MDRPDPVFDLASSERVEPPAVRPAPAGKETAVLVAAGVGLGAAIAGPPGALLGGAVGCAVDAVRRRLMVR